jgi:hypothetical protein
MKKVSISEVYLPGIKLNFMIFSGLFLYFSRILFGFCLACGFYATLLFTYAFYIIYLIDRPAKQIILCKKPVDDPIKEIPKEPETALWLNAILDQLFYAAGGLKLVEIFHAAFIKTMEEKSSQIKSSDLRLLIQKLLVKDFHLGKRLPQIMRILTKQLDGQDFALVFDISFEQGCMITELGAEMGLGLKSTSAKLLGTRFVGKMVFKFELLPTCRVSFLASEMPHFRLFLSYGENPMPRLSSVVEYIMRGVLSSRLIYPFYQCGIINFTAEKKENLVYLSPASGIRASLLLNIVRAKVDKAILEDCNSIQCSVQINTMNDRVKTPFISAKSPLEWKYSYTFQIPTGKDEIELSFRLINKRKLLGSEVLGQYVLFAKDFPLDSLEHITLKLNDGISLDVEVFCARNIQSGFIDREWIFYNSTPPLPLFEDETNSPSLDKVNWTNIKFVFEKLFSSSQQDDESINDNSFEGMIEEIPPAEIKSSYTEIVVNDNIFLNLFCHAASSLVKFYHNQQIKNKKGEIFFVEEEDEKFFSMLETILIDMRKIDIHDSIKAISIPLNVQVKYPLLVKMLNNSKENIQPLDITKHNQSEIPLRRTLSFGEDIFQGFRDSTKTIISRSSIISLGIDNLACFEPLEKGFHEAQPAIYKGRKVFIIIDRYFIWWFLKSDTQFFPLDFISLDSLEQVIFKLPNIHYLASDSNEFSSKDYLLTLITTSKARHNFISTGTSSFQIIYSSLQGHLGPQSLEVESCLLLKTLGSSPVMILNDHLVVNDPTFALYNLIKRTCKNLKNELTSSYLELRFDFKIENPITELAFDCSFFYRGVCTGKCIIFPDHLLFEGSRNRLVPVIGIFPLREIHALTLQKKFLIGTGIKISLADTSFFLYSIEPPDIIEQLLSLKPASSCSLDT